MVGVCGHWAMHSISFLSFCGICIGGQQVVGVSVVGERLSRDGISVPVAVPGSSGALPLESLVLASFENWRKVMPKGSAPNGIPILDPFVVPFDISIRIPLRSSTGFYELVLSKLTFAGLSSFRVKSLRIEPVSRAMSFENYVGNMNATSDYSLKYYFSQYLPLPVPISDGVASGAIHGADLKGGGTVLPTAGNWFQLARLAMSFNFESLDIRIYPNIPFLDSTLEKRVSQSVYDGIERMRPNISELTTTTYVKTVELKLT